MLLYHHNRPLKYTAYDVVIPYRLTHHALPSCHGQCDFSDDWHNALHFEAAYRWLAERTGFWPLFLGVGATDDDRRMTGYQSQFRKETPTTEVPENDILFSWEEIPSSHLVFTCYDHWHIPLNMIDYSDKHHPQVAGMTTRMGAWVFHPSWTASDWLRQARREVNTVQAVVPQLDLRTASEITCRNQKTKKTLLKMGFQEEKITVRHLKVDYDF